MLPITNHFNQLKILFICFIHYDTYILSVYFRFEVILTKIICGFAQSFLDHMNLSQQRLLLLFSNHHMQSYITVHPYIIIFPRIRPYIGIIGKLSFLLYHVGTISTYLANYMA
jgi:hypothetical protein